MQNQRLKVLGFFEVILAGMGFGFLGIFGRLSFAAGMSMGELLTYRFLFASLFLWVGLFIFKRSLIRLPWRQVLLSGLLGIFGYAVLSTMYFKAIEGVSVAIAAMLLFTFPIFVNLGAHFFLQEKMHPRQWISLFLGFVGLVVLLWGDLTIEKSASVFWGLASAVTYAVYVLVSGKLQKNVPPLSSSLYVITAAALSLGIYHQPDLSRLLHFQWNQYLYILGIALFCTIMPLTFFLSGMQKISSSKASIVVMIEPLTATIAGWLVLGETLNTLQFGGAFLVLTGLALSFR